jgi:rhodanese-related sulfurtransferase
MDFLLQNIFWAALAVVSGCLLLWNQLRSEGGDLSAQQAVNLINRENAVILDVRDHMAFQEAHVTGAKNVALGLIESGKAELEKFKGRPIVVYGNGRDAVRAVKLLKTQGFERAAGLDGGMVAWAEAGLPIDN